MNQKKYKRHLAYDVLILLCMLALLTFVCRLWPILLLIILGIFIAMLRLLFLSSKEVEVIKTDPVIPEQPEQPSYRNAMDYVYAVILRRITELVNEEYPGANWVWVESNTKKRIERGEPVSIVLNKAGGYRKAKVIIEKLHVKELVFTQEIPTGIKMTIESEVHDVPGEMVDEQENYELLAFEWVEAHILELNERCNEAIGSGNKELILSPDELPVRDSWEAICEELKRADLTDVVCDDNGIKINLMQ